VDFLVANDGVQMQRHLHAVLHDAELASALTTHGLATIRARHTCAHRVDELLAILSSLDAPVPERSSMSLRRVSHA
jgi:spore maturation protein CgeB